MLSSQNVRSAGKLSFCVMQGNNPDVIRRCMQGRITGDDCWEEMQPNTSQLLNFKWKPTSFNIDFGSLSQFGVKQLVNHVEGHKALTTKDELYLNLKAHCELNNKNVFDFVPFTLKLDCNDEAIFNEQYSEIFRVVSLVGKMVDRPVDEINAELLKQRGRALSARTATA